MSQVVGLPNNSYKHITNTACVRARLCKLQKGCSRLAAASDKFTSCLPIIHGRWFSPDTPASSTTKTGRHDISEILLKVALNTKNQIKSSNPSIYGIWLRTFWALKSYQKSLKFVGNKVIKARGRSTLVFTNYPVKTSELPQVSAFHIYNNNGEYN